MRGRHTHIHSTTDRDGAAQTELGKGGWVKRVGRER